LENFEKIRNDKNPKKANFGEKAHPCHVMLTRKQSPFDIQKVINAR